MMRLWSYDPESGHFSRLTARGTAQAVGERAGSLGNTGRWVLFFKGRKYLAHRVAWLFMTGTWPAGEIDHINRKPADNKWANLREATRGENMHNATCRVNKFGQGVKKNRRGFIARIRVNKKEVYLGYFKTPEAAHAAYIAAKAQYLPVAPQENA